MVPQVTPAVATRRLGGASGGDRGGDVLAGWAEGLSGRAAGRRSPVGQPRIASHDLPGPRVQFPAAGGAEIGVDRRPVQRMGTGQLQRRIAVGQQPGGDRRIHLVPRIGQPGNRHDRRDRRVLPSTARQYNALPPVWAANRDAPRCDSTPSPSALASSVRLPGLSPARRIRVTLESPLANRAQPGT